MTQHNVLLVTTAKIIKTPDDSAFRTIKCMWVPRHACAVKSTRNPSTHRKITFTVGNMLQHLHGVSPNVLYVEVG